jgi:nicotinamidase/pyrazinamidase
MKRVVIVVDTQGDFMRADGALSVAGADALIGPMTDWLRALRPDDAAAVVFTFDTHDPETYPTSAEAQQFPPHCYRGTDGWANMLSPEDVDAAIPTWRLLKGVFAMWEEPALLLEPLLGAGASPRDRDAFFAELRAAGVEEAVVIGVAADYCVRWAVDGLVERGFRVTVPAALTRGIARGIEEVVAQDFAGRAVAVA